MRALAAVAVSLALWSCANAHQLPTRDHLSHSLLSVLGVKEHTPVHRLLTCGQKLGPTKCLSALSVWRAEKALKLFENGTEENLNLTADVSQFPYERYSNSTNDQLYSELCDGTEKLLKYRSLSLTLIPGYSFELESRGNGTLNVDVFTDAATGTARSSMKKLYKQFYNIAPLLLLPGLIMSAILPFVLPALKMSVVAAGMLNNMALSGAVFTLLRNNAFSDHYEKKVIYVNEGYKNEKLSPVYLKELDIPMEQIDVEYSPSNMYAVAETQPGDDFNSVAEAPTNEDWINQYYGNDRLKVRRSSHRQRYRVRHNK